MIQSYTVLPTWLESVPEYTGTLPDPSTVGTVVELAEALQTLMYAVSVTTVREVSRRCTNNLPSHTTLRTMLTGKRLPSKDVMLVFIQALDPREPLAPWGEAWQRVADTLPQVPRQGSIPANKRV